MKALARSWTWATRCTPRLPRLSTGLITRSRPAFDGDALQFLRRRHFRKPGHRHAGGPEAFLHRQLVAGQFGHMQRKAGQAQALRHGGGGDRRIGGDADHAVDLADLAVIALGGGGGFRRAIDIGDQAGIGEGKAGRLGIDVGDDDSIAPSPWRGLRRVGRLDAAGNDQQGLAAVAIAYSSEV